MKGLKRVFLELFFIFTIEKVLPDEILPAKLLHLGEYFDDIDRKTLQRETYCARQNNERLSCDVLKQSVTDQGLV